MTNLNEAQIYQDALKVGFNDAQAKIMAAIAMAESGGNPNAVGDVALENATWGPSVGLTQVRTLKKQTGTGGDRDINKVLGDPIANLKAAYDISSHGTTFTPWSTYTSGAYKKYLGGGSTVSGAVADKQASQLQAKRVLARATADANLYQNEVANPDSYEAAAKDLLKPISSVGDLIGFLGNSDNWIRIAFIGVGLILVVIAASKMVSSPQQTASAPAPVKVAEKSAEE